MARAVHPVWTGDHRRDDHKLYRPQPADGASTRYKFTGKERDTESGLDYFGARYYGSSMGRFMSPDSTAYSGLTNPQSWNLYAYTLNNPLSYIDPTGHTVECTTAAAGCLAAAQGAVGKDAPGQLTTQTTTTQNWLQKILGTSTSTTTLQITGDEADFRAAVVMLQNWLT